MEGLSGALYSNCAKHSSARDVLVLQDTSEVNLNHLLGKLSIQDNDIGVLTSSDSFGFFLHPSLVLDAHTAFPLGFSAVHIWNRALEHYDKVQRNYKNLAIEDKESYRWLESAEQSKAQLSEARSITFISDRESDIYEYFARIPEEHTHLLVRMTQNRLLSDSSLKLFEYLSSQEQAFEMRVPIAHNAQRKPRKAKLSVRYGKVSLQKPVQKKTDDPESLSLWAIEVLENTDSVPEGEEAICWPLLTTHQVTCLADALKIVEWYAWRWLIEELFRLLKSQGLDLESTRLKLSKNYL